MPPQRIFRADWLCKAGQAAGDLLPERHPTADAAAGTDHYARLASSHRPSKSNNTQTEWNVQVLVRDNNVDQALRALKKKMQREGVFREMKLRNFYEKPSEKRAREKAEAIRRARKLARKKAQREGLLPAKGRR